MQKTCISPARSLIFLFRNPARIIRNIRFNAFRAQKTKRHAAESCRGNSRMMQSKLKKMRHCGTVRRTPSFLEINPGGSKSNLYKLYSSYKQGIIFAFQTRKGQTRTCGAKHFNFVALG
jgi:hypothetical protein